MFADLSAPLPQFAVSAVSWSVCADSSAAARANATEACGEPPPPLPPPAASGWMRSSSSCGLVAIASCLQLPSAPASISRRRCNPVALSRVAAERLSH